MGLTPGAKRLEAEPSRGPARASERERRAGSSPAPGVPLYLRADGQPKALQPKLLVGAAQDPLEQEADEVASTVSSGSSATTSGCACATGASCATCGSGDRLRRKSISSAGAASAGAREVGIGSDVQSTLSQPGQPLEASVRADMESQLGADFSDVRAHVDPLASRSARSLGARAYTAGSHVVFGEGELRPSDPGGRRLLAHELVHVLQQRGGTGATSIQRDTTQQRTADETAGRADRAASSAGPCGVDAGALSNQGLLLQLNRARVYLSQHTWGEDATYDYNNLLVRLTAERRRRISGGHVWLAQPGTIAPPDELYSLEPGVGLTLVVRSLPGSSAAGGYLALSSTLVTRSQFVNLLGQQNVPTVDMVRILDEVFGGAHGPGAATSLELPAPPAPSGMRLGPATASPFLWEPQNPNVGSLFGATPFGFGGNALPARFWMPLGPGGSPLDGFASAPLGFGPAWSNETYRPDAAAHLRDVRRLPGLVSSSGPERLFIPRPAARPAPMQVMLVDAAGNMAPLGVFDASALGNSGEGPTGLSSLGFLHRPAVLPSGTSGIMWEGSHVSQFSVMHDRMLTMGFRAPFDMHARDSLSGHRSTATSDLNVGTPGLYANDALFPMMGEIWGRGPLAPSHWRRGSVAIVRADGTPLQAAELMRVMVESGPVLSGQEYRFSPPPVGSSAERAADEAARRRGQPGFDRSRGAQMCINPPCVPLNEIALGGPLTFTQADGTVIDLSNPDQATARAMSEFMGQPDEFWQARGLRRVDVGRRVLGSYGGGAGIGVGMSLLSDAYRASQGEHPDWVTDAAISGGSNLVSAAAEDYAYTALTSRLARVPGLSSGGASALGRFGSSTGVAIVIAPLTTGAEMYFSDQHYTNIDYAARMTRSTVAGTTSALATIGTAAALGSAAGPAGTVVGILVGVVVYAATDALVGDMTEEGVREALGERGCTGGVGPGR